MLAFGVGCRAVKQYALAKILQILKKPLDMLSLSREKYYALLTDYRSTFSRQSEKRKNAHVSRERTALSQ